MKFLAIMGYEETRPKVRSLFQEHKVSMISSMDIRGCNCEKTGLQAEAWFNADEIVGTYSTLCLLTYKPLGTCFEGFVSLTTKVVLMKLALQF